MNNIDLQERFSKIESYFEHRFDNSCERTVWLCSCDESASLVAVHCESAVMYSNWNSDEEEYIENYEFKLDFTHYFEFHEIFDYLLKYFNHDPFKLEKYLLVTDLNKDYVRSYVSGYDDKKQLELFLNNPENNQESILSF
ncbi:MAG: hypothetical protein M8364_12840 [Methylobacter sp.]|uniref:hypothetical protein n=1 Tax=Methylobacter sp. TaxID=2051955 RepID=UPI00258E6C26|nr:hypothetical protein [Methylobacter sp.]MCL7421782.1 hypothetical protein [Methylobacter sp.]